MHNACFAYLCPSVQRCMRSVQMQGEQRHTFCLEMSTRAVHDCITVVLGAGAVGAKGKVESAETAMLRCSYVLLQSPMHSFFGGWGGGGWLYLCSGLQCRMVLPSYQQRYSSASDINTQETARLLRVRLQQYMAVSH